MENRCTIIEGDLKCSIKYSIYVDGDSGLDGKLAAQSAMYFKLKINTNVCSSLQAVNVTLFRFSAASCRV